MYQVWDSKIVVMKLKEIPISLYHHFRFQNMNCHNLKRKKGDELPVLISLTSIPSRLTTVHITIRSILAQNPKPSKILLWLHEDLKDKIPRSLEKLKGEIFEIRFTHLKCSHKKLINTLHDFPDWPIVTCDDDCMYNKDWLLSLYLTHKKCPKKIVAHRLRCIRYDEEKKLLPYKQWHLGQNDNPRALLPIGAEGVLYPPKIFSEITWNENLFLKLTPKADDLWFKAMALKENILPVQAENSPENAIPLLGTQKVSLKKENVDMDKNRVQWEALVKYFDLKIS